LSSDEKRVVVDFTSPDHFATLPEEHYLRGLADLDLGDPHSVTDFISTWGVPLDEVAGTFSLDEAVARLAWIRDMTDAWDHLSGGITFEEMLDGWEGSSRPSDSAEAAALLQELGDVLTDFVPCLSISGAPVYRTGLAGALATQLFNHIAESKGYLRCADPKCGRRFVRHLNRTGVPGPEKRTVRFCSQQCQDRYFNEEFRRRQRVAKLRMQGLSKDEIALKMKATEQDVARWLDSLDQLG
jgi:hypothetical protein